MSDLGNMKSVNTFMIGAVSDCLPFPAEVVRTNIIQRLKEYKPELVEINEQAFVLGRVASESN